MKDILFLTLLCISQFAYSSPAEEPPETRVPILDSVQELLGARASFAANRLDSFFATDRADDEFGRSRIRIRSQYEVQERSVAEHGNQYRINLKLPHLEDKFRFDYYQDNKKDTRNKKISKAPISDLDERERLKSAKLNEGWIFNSDIGVTAAIPPRLTVRARVRKNLVTGTFIHRFVEQFTYRTDESGLVEETRVESDHIFNSDLIFRFQNIVQWEIQNENFDTNHGPTLLQRVTQNDAFNYGLGLQTLVTEGIWYVNNYKVSVNYRRNVYKQFVYFDLTPGIDFPKQWSFRRTPFIFTQIEFLFGG